MSDCLIELGTEELPPKALLKLSKAFTAGVEQGLSSAGLTAEKVESFSSPRRLAILFTNIPSAQQDQVVEKRGPALQAAYDAEGNPTKAAEGFARSCGVNVSELSKKETDKGTWLYFEQKQKGQSMHQILPEIVEDSLAKLPIPKRMRWGSNIHEFVRPVHWLVLMLDNELIKANIMGIDSSSETYGHRFHAPQAIKLTNAGDYDSILTQTAFVIADFDKRREIIRNEIHAMAKMFGGQALIDEGLLDEVTALVEWPVAIGGRFDEEFLSIPSEALVTTMQDNQKYFAVFDNNNLLLPYFITVSNIDSKNPKVVAHGNERVIRPRFADAMFFWKQDQKVTLSSRLQSLESVVFQKQLGSIGDKVIRIRKISGYLAQQLSADISEAERTAELCKCDLMTDMVGEFPKLQGIIGSYYAKHDGETDNVAEGIEQHYWPRFSGDTVPHGSSGQCVAIADRIDTMMGIFAIGQKPTGVKDPFGLRRAALGIIRISIENNLPIDIYELCKQASQGLADKLDASKTIDEVADYIYDRLRAYYQDQEIAADLIDAVVSCKPTVLIDLHNRVMAVNEFLSQDAAVALAAANKRISNILKKQDESIGLKIKEDLFIEAAEKELFTQLSDVEKVATQNFNSGDYLKGLNELSALRPVVDQFFDDVMVMCDDENLKKNRLALLQKLANSFLQVADFSRIQ